MTTSIAGSGAELLIGVSLSREVTASHNPSVETLLDGLSGVCAGVDREPADQPRISGVALYAFWEATEPDWQLWEQ